MCGQIFVINYSIQGQRPEYNVYLKNVTTVHYVELIKLGEF